MFLWSVKHDFPNWLLGSLARSLPNEEKLWADALLSELAQIPGDGQQLSWALSGSWGLGKIWMRARLRALLPEHGRPLAVSLIALYHAVFSCAIVVALLGQLPRIRTPWREAIVPLLIAFFVALVPGVIAVGLWVLDDAARFMAMAFSLLHAMGNCAWISTLHVGWKPLPAGRVLLDLLMIGILSLPSMSRVFRPPRVELGLRS